jgi:hypothetical protein
LLPISHRRALQSSLLIADDILDRNLRYAIVVPVISNCVANEVASGDDCIRLVANSRKLLE